MHTFVCAFEPNRRSTPSTIVIDSASYRKYNCSNHFPYLLNEFLCIVSMFLFFSIFPCCLSFMIFINCRNFLFIYTGFSLSIPLIGARGAQNVQSSNNGHIRKFIQSNHMHRIKAIAWNIHWIYVKHNTYMHLFIQQIEHRNCF